MLLQPAYLVAIIVPSKSLSDLSHLCIALMIGMYVIKNGGLSVMGGGCLDFGSWANCGPLLLPACWCKGLLFCLILAKEQPLGEYAYVM